MKDKAEELRKQFQQENSRDDLFTVFHVKWLEQKLIDQQSKEEAKESKWISVEDIPPPARCLLLTTSKMVVVGDRYKGIWRIDGATRWVSRDSSNGRYVNRYRVLVSNYNDGDITHWMPLPDPPR